MVGGEERNKEYGEGEKKRRRKDEISLLIVIEGTHARHRMLHISESRPRIYTRTRCHLRNESWELYGARHGHRFTTRHSYGSAGSPHHHQNISLSSSGISSLYYLYPSPLSPLPSPLSPLPSPLSPLPSPLSPLPSPLSPLPSPLSPLPIACKF